jgi:hypothetical protein
VKSYKKSFSTNVQPARSSSDTDRRVYKVISQNATGASRGLSEGCVTEAKLLDEERIVTEQVCCLLRASERGDWVGLEKVEVGL